MDAQPNTIPFVLFHGLTWHDLFGITALTCLIGLDQRQQF